MSNTTPANTSLVLSQAIKLASTMSINGDPEELLATLKQTAFKGQVSDAQMTALLIVAGQYGLNPWTKEIYAFPDKNNGIVPVVGVDGWSRIMNDHPQFDGMEFEQDDESCTCKIFRKDRGRPIVVTEYMAECKRTNVGPWTSHPKRMLRHKAMIQCARIAFGYGGIFDQDEAEVIVEAKNMGNADVVDKPRVAMPQARNKPAPAAASAPAPQQGDVIDNETGEVLDAKHETQQRQPTRPAQQQTASGQASVGMIAFIRKKAAEKGIDEATVCDANGIETLDGISEEVGNLLVTWIKAQ